MVQYSGPNPNLDNSNIWQSLTCAGASKAVAIELDWSVEDRFEVDLLYANQQGFLPSVGTIWFNNARSSNAAGAATAQRVEVNIAGTTQNISLRAGREGYIPVLCPEPGKFTFTGEGNAARTQIIFISALLPGVITNAGT